MKIFLKWTLRSFLSLLLVVSVTILSVGFAESKIDMAFLALAIGSLFLGVTFYFLEVKYLPWRKNKILKRLVKIFEAEILSDSMTQFSLCNFDFYTKIIFKLSLSAGADVELVHFHIPKEQIDRLSVKPKFKLNKSTCNGLQTYDIYQTNNIGLKLAKRRFEKRLTETKNNGAVRFPGNLSD